MSAWWRVGVFLTCALVVAAIVTGKALLVMIALPALAALWTYAFAALCRPH
jgi:hypothetical protein